LRVRPPTVGLFDSGVGGLSVWREVIRQLPYADLIYVADQAHCPYGARSLREIRALARGITAFHVEQGADAVVLACNTASAAALRDLRARFALPIVGMEPAVKPAVAQTKTGHVGVIATEVTFQGTLFASLLERFAQDVTVHTQACPGLVECVEAGALDDRGTVDLLGRLLRPLLDADVDTLVLGCTHYPFLRRAIARVVGPSVTIIDPAPAVARQTARVLARARPGVPRERQGGRTLYTSGDAAHLRQAVARLLGSSGAISSVRWERGSLVAVPE
jgi:glutamate racemase